MVALAKIIPLHIYLTRIDGENEIRVEAVPPESDPKLTIILEKDSFISPRFVLKDPQRRNRSVATITRKHLESSDAVTVAHDDGIYPAAVVTSQGAKNHANEGGNADSNQAN